MKVSKSLIRSFYDLQKQRIQIGNRICAEIKARLGQVPSKPEKELSKESLKYLKEARKEYKRITDTFILNKAHIYLDVPFEDFHIISDPVTLLFVETYVKQLEYEEKMEKVIEKIVSQHPMWTYFLRGVDGCGPLMSAVILTEFDVTKERISMFWKYAGLDVAEDGRGRGRYAEHLVDMEYTNKDGKQDKRKSITFNPFLKTKLVGVLAGCFLQQVKYTPTCKEVYDITPEDRRKIKKDASGKEYYWVMISEGKYRKIYFDYKHRLENHAVYGVGNDKKRIAEAEKNGKKYSPVGHRNNMAKRYMIKMFVQDLWLAWRECEGLPVTRPYAEEVLGHKHHEDAA